MGFLKPQGENSMLSLRLKSGEYISIGNDIAVQIFKQTGDSFQVAVKAPREVPILRGEVLERSDARPDGLRESRSKSPSEIKASAKRLATLAKREKRKAVVEQMGSILDILEAKSMKNCAELQEMRRLLDLVI